MVTNTKKIITYIIMEQQIKFQPKKLNQRYSEGSIGIKGDLFIEEYSGYKK